MWAALGGPSVIGERGPEGGVGGGGVGGPLAACDGSEYARGMEKQSTPSKRGGPRPGSGRPRGVPNRATTEFRATVQRLLDDNAENVATWLAAVANGVPAVLDAEGKVATPGRPGDPATALTKLTALAEFASPKLNRSEVTGDAGGPLHITIHKLA